VSTCSQTVTGLADGEDLAQLHDVLDGRLFAGHPHLRQLEPRLPWIRIGPL